MKINLISHAVLSLSLLAAFISFNGNSAKHTHFDAHIHGVSELTLVIEKQQLEIEMRSPAQNLVGFEHHAKTDKEHAAIASAERLLMQHDNLFLISDKNCVFVSHDIDVSNMNSHQHENIAHQNIIARYSYHCKTQSLTPLITIKVFDLFPGIHQINARWITESRQGSSRLNINNRILEIKS